MSYPFCDDSVELVKYFEGFKSAPYICPTGHPTIGYGHMILDGEEFDTLTEDEASTLLIEDLQSHWEGIASHIEVDLDTNQIGAITSLVYNLGVHAIVDSTLLKCVNASQFHQAALEFPKWCHGGKIVLPGLVKRRNAEKAMFLSQNWKDTL